MAGGKLSPRQKMINLMYLVFIAMMAMNMSKEVLSAFGLINQKLIQSNVRATDRNTSFMEQLAQKVEEQPKKFKPEMEKAKVVNSISSDLDTYIKDLKGLMLEGMTDEDKKNYETMDKDVFLGEYFFANGVVTEKGKEFVSKIGTYKNEMIKLLSPVEGGPKDQTDFSEIIDSIKADFSTEDETTKDGLKLDWLTYNYKGFPKIASLTKLTQIQADIKKNQSEILSNILSGKLKSEISLNNFDAIVVADKTAFFPGERFKGKIVLGKNDKTLKAHKVVINGRTLPESSMKEGQTILNFPVGNVGEKSIKGEFQFIENGKTIKIPVKSSYSVIPKPNSAVIAADKMNVVYRGVKNPMTISMPGVSSIYASASGLSKVSAGKYTMDPTSLKQREVTISVTGKLSNGEKVSDSKKFRIKDIPRPVGTVRGEDGSVKMSKSSLAITTVGASLPDFDFNLKLNVTGFKIKVPGQPTVRVSGNKMDSRASSAIKRAKRGQSVQIFDINAKLASGGSYRVKKVSPVIIELTN